MYSRILVPLDGSTLAAQALPYAGAIARALNAEVELLCVMPGLAEMMMARDTRYDNGGIEDTLPGPTLDQWRELHRQMLQAAEDDLGEWAQGLRAAGVTVRKKVGEGVPAETIAREADGIENTLIVMTTHGRSGLRRMWMGSVTDKVLGATSAPALVTRSREDGEAALSVEPALRHIVLPLDGSGLAEQAIPHAMAVAKAMGARVDVLTAVNAPSAHLPIRFPVPEAFPTDLNARAGEYAVGILDRLRSAGVEAEANTVEDDAASAIIDLAQGMPDSLVVMTTHGRSGFQRTMRGSVADKVVRHSERPVLLVRAREEALGERAA